MSDADALLAAIRAAPDDAPRLIYADWLEEHGQPERAEFIRVQCELARNGSLMLRHREAELLADHHDGFAGPLAAPGLRFRFVRGFPIAFGHTGLFTAIESGVRVHPLHHYIRFYPNGVLFVFSTTLTARQVIGAYQAACKLALQATYTLFALTAPVLLKAKEKLRPGFRPETLTEYSGTLMSNSIALIEFEPESGRRTERRYAHMPVRRFDSFQDSPQDAV